VVSVPSGLDTERLAQRFFENVYSLHVLTNTAITAPGEVSCYLHPVMGLLDIGRYPQGTDAVTRALAADLTRAGFQAEERADATGWKRGKLLTNAGTNVIRAACPADDQPLDLVAEAREECAQVFRAAGLGFETSERVLGRVFDTGWFGQKVGGQGYPGSSTTQELTRRSRSTEIEYVNGEIVLLGRELGVPTPVNLMLQQLMREMLRIGPASQFAYSSDDLRGRVKRMEPA
jgi:2-dehydropantoate 2-reductase